jgi:hypothetical protein
VAISLLEVNANPNKLPADEGAQISIRDLIRQIATGWPSYHRKLRVDKTDPVYALVTVDFPKALHPRIASYDNITPEGSTGAGNITAAPWIALFDRRLTTSATSGYYVVYLFSTDMSTVTLSLAFGTTQFDKQFGGPSSAFPRMRSAAARLQEMFNHLIPTHMLRGPIDLRAEPRQKLHYSYEQASILSYPPYSIGALPEESRLVADLQALVKLYTEIVSDPLEATVDRLVEAVIEPAPTVETIQVQDFQPRPPRNTRLTVDPTTRGRERRYSPESRKVGDAGERVVLGYERDRLINLGRPDLADRVRWHGQQQDFCGWDITSFDAAGNEFYIEVKSSIGTTISCINLTVNEWQAACNAKRKERYYIYYLVTNALSVAPRIERLQNPASYVEKGQLGCEAIVYELQLRRPKTGCQPPSSDVDSGGIVNIANGPRHD